MPRCVFQATTAQTGAIWHMRGLSGAQACRFYPRFKRIREYEGHIASLIPFPCHTRACIVRTSTTATHTTTTTSAVMHVQRALRLVCLVRLQPFFVCGSSSWATFNWPFLYWGPLPLVSASLLRHWLHLCPNFPQYRQLPLKPCARGC